MQQKELIEKAKQYAQKNYNKGYDTFVECYGDKEWAEFTLDYETKLPMSWREVRDAMDAMADVWNERRADAINSAF